MAIDRHVRRTGSDYRDALLRLLPQGLAWPRLSNSVLYTTVSGLTQIFGDVDDRAADLLETETDPRTANELLPEWERAFGLPDPLAPVPPTDLATRRTLLVNWITLKGRQDRQFFINVAATFGMTVTIREYAPYMTGVSRVGDSRQASLTVDTLHFRWELGAPETRFYWTVRLESLLPSYSGADMLAVLQRWKPAQTQIVMDYSLFNYGNFSYPWWSGNICLF